jgi:nanoRNase/pAp phosphatase (c-di-AMP/oligoRNAs hydrolase)
MSAKNRKIVTKKNANIDTMGRNKSRQKSSRNQVADFFTRAYGLGWIFVSGVYQENVIIIVRNDGYRKDAGRLVRNAFGDLGSAGGHSGAARVEISLRELKLENLKQQDRDLVAFIRNRLDF